MIELNRPDYAKNLDDHQGNIVEEVRIAIEDAWDHERENRREASLDMQFLAGDQWPEAVRREREAEGRPMLTINRLPQFVRQITNDIRQAELAIKASPVDDQSDVDLARIYDGLMRQIQYQSSAQHVYATAAEHQASCGIGWFRITTEYIDDASFDQEIRAEAIQNPLSVYCDPAAVLPDRSDASWIAITDLIPKRAFEAMYPDIPAESVSAPTDEDTETDRSFWVSGDQVRIAEYWRKTPIDKEIGLLSSGEVIDLDGFPKKQRAFLDIVQTRTVKTHKVECWIVTGQHVLSGPHEWLGKHIPVVAVVGGEFPLEKQTYRYGAIRFARDPQQLYNYYRTASAEHIAKSPKSPFVGTEDQIKPYKRMWDTANNRDRPYLLYKPDTKAPGPPKREAAPEPPAALVQEVGLASEDMKATTGIYDAGLGARSNETSGKAIVARDQQGDVANYHFIDNLKRSLEHAGRIMFDLIPKVYDTERVVRLMGEDDSEEVVRINQTIYMDDGMPVMINDLSAGRFDVRVTIGKAYTTKRMEQADSMMQFLQAFPDAAAIAGDLFAKAFDWPGAEELSKRLKATVPPEIIEAAQNDGQLPPPPDPAQQGPDPAMEAEMAKAQAATEKDTQQARKYAAEADTAELENMMAVQAIENGFAGGQPVAPPDVY
ncbi:MAG: portal protein [Filomicrobium sp.]